MTDAGPGDLACVAGKRKPGPPKGYKRPPVTRYSPELVDAICERIAAGELFYRICREPSMPSSQSVRMWSRRHPEVGEKLRAARAESRRPAGGGVCTYDETVADEVFERLCDGESLTAIGEDPTMPSLSTIFAWRRRYNGFDESVRLGQRIFAERLADEGWEMALEADPKTAYLTHVRLAHMRWWVGVLAPRKYRAKPPPSEEPEVTNILFRRFHIEVDPETGEEIVASYCPNPFTGEVERDNVPGWVKPGDDSYQTMPEGFGPDDGWRA